LEVSTATTYSCDVLVLKINSFLYLSYSYNSSSGDVWDLFEEEEIVMTLALRANKRTKDGDSCGRRGSNGTTSLCGATSWMFPFSTRSILGDVLE
jgi:hypothetical protein